MAVSPAATIASVVAEKLPSVLGNTATPPPPPFAVGCTGLELGVGVGFELGLGFGFGFGFGFGAGGSTGGTTADAVQAPFIPGLVIVTEKLAPLLFETVPEVALPPCPFPPLFTLPDATV